MTLRTLAPLGGTVLSGTMVTLGRLWSVWPDRELRPSFNHWLDT